MRVLMIICWTLITLQGLQAQNPTPNSGFESWSQVSNYYNPDGWNNLNSNTAILGVLTCSRVTAAADVHSGTYAVKLTTRSVFGVTANGIASTATLITTPPYGVTGGISYNLRPDSITGWFKYTPASPSDSGFFQFVLQGSAGDTIGYVKWCTPNSTVTTYTRFTAPITYFSNAAPANSYWILSSSDGINPVVNSALIVDDLSLVFNTSSLNESMDEHAFVAYPNPVTERLHISLRSTASFRILGIDGRMVMSGQLEQLSNEIDVAQLPSGVYTLQLTADNKRSCTRFVKH